MESKILPLNLNTDLNTECWNKQIIAMALTNKNNYSWYVERLNDYYFNENLNYQFYYRRSLEHGFLVDYEEVLRVKIFLTTKNPIEFVRKKIMANEYVSIMCESTSYTYIAKYHEFLVVGYDEENIYFYNYFNNNSFIDKMNNNDFTKRYENAKNYFSKDFILRAQQETLLPLTTFKVKNNKQRKINLSILIYTLEDILFEKKEVHIGKFGKAVFFHSLSTCKIISKFLNKSWENKRPFMVIKLLQKYYETRKSLKNKINYLKIYEYNEEFEKVLNKINLCKNIFSKYMITKDEKVVIKIKKLLKEIHNDDINCLTKLNTKLTDMFSKNIVKALQ